MSVSEVFGEYRKPFYDELPMRTYWTGCGKTQLALTMSVVTQVSPTTSTNVVISIYNSSCQE